MYQIIVLVISLLAGVVALGVVAPRLRIPFPILLVVGGILIGLVPELPHVELHPELVFLLFLPPILYHAAWFTSWRDFKFNLRSILLLAIGLVLLTMVVVAVITRMLIPEFSWAAAFVLGAIISPPDAVAATSIMQKLPIPRRVVAILEGESLVNDATALVALRFALVAVVSGSFSLAEASTQFVFVSIGGILIGLVLGWLISQIHRRMENAQLEISITLLTPFVAYLLAEAVHVSGVLATVVAGLYVSRRSSDLFSSSLRLKAHGVWDTLIFIINGLIFILIGLQLPAILGTLGDQSQIGTLIGYVVILSLAVILLRFAWVFPAAYLPHYFSARVRANETLPDWRNVVIVAWTGLRGVVSLAAALSLPLVLANGRPFPERDMILFLTFGVIIVTLVFQGLALPLLIRLLALRPDTLHEDEERHARLTTIRAALERIEVVATEDGMAEEHVEHLRMHYRVRQENMLAHSDRHPGHTHGHGEDLAYMRLQQEALKAERRILILLRNRGEINDETLRVLEQELDLDEQRLERHRELA